MNIDETGTEAPRSAERAPEAPEGLSGTERRADGLTTADRAWKRAHEYAINEGMEAPRDFADEYAFMIEDFSHELHYPDRPLPTPEDFTTM